MLCSYSQSPIPKKSNLNKPKPKPNSIFTSSGSGSGSASVSTQLHTNRPYCQPTFPRSPELSVFRHVRKFEKTVKLLFVKVGPLSSLPDLSLHFSYPLSLLSLELPRSIHSHNYTYIHIHIYVLH